MKHLKIAKTPGINLDSSDISRLIKEVDPNTLNVSELLDVGAIVIHADEVYKYADKIINRGYEIPFVIVCSNQQEQDLVAEFDAHDVTVVMVLESQRIGNIVEQVCSQYEEYYLPDFFYLLHEYANERVKTFACPGHQGGGFFREHPVGKRFYDFYGENLFRSDICNADVKLGDLLIHEGAAKSAQKKAAKLYKADKTYFVLNGTSTANKIVCGALLQENSLVLFDRNNHKSAHHGALVLSGAKPIYLETARNPYGFIGGIDSRCFEEDYIRALIAENYPERANEKRPFRLAIIQLCTYDGTLYNPRFVIDKIGHLCEYILFDSAWAGYEQFIPFTKHLSPLNLKLTNKDPGIFVTQSVHKQQAGFSQASQIHKKDSHLRGKKRYCNHKRFNNSYMLHASTSPFYPIFASLDVNAKIQTSNIGRFMWQQTVKLATETRKQILQRCRYITPFVATEINGKKWQDYSTDEICNNMDFFYFKPNEKWHSYEGYAENQYMIDPCKLLLTTPGINIETGEYESFGVPAAILASYLRENSVISEKSDLNSILFLLTPAESIEKMNMLVDYLVEFENHINNNSPLSVVLPSLYNNYIDRYQNYTIKQLCSELHNIYIKYNIKDLQKRLFRKSGFPDYAMSPKDAHQYLIRNEVSLLPISEIKGRIAADGALPYPPGVICVVPGERWTEDACNYFLALESIINDVIGFTPEIQGVFLENVNGRKVAFGYVVNEDGSSQWENN